MLLTIELFTYMLQQPTTFEFFDKIWCPVSQSNNLDITKVTLKNGHFLMTFLARPFKRTVISEKSLKESSVWTKYSPSFLKDSL